MAYHDGIIYQNQAVRVVRKGSKNIRVQEAGGNSFLVPITEFNQALKQTKSALGLYPGLQGMTTYEACLAYIASGAGTDIRLAGKVQNPRPLIEKRNLSRPRIRIVPYEVGEHA